MGRLDSISDSVSAVIDYLLSWLRAADVWNLPEVWSLTEERFNNYVNNDITFPYKQYLNQNNKKTDKVLECSTTTYHFTQTNVQQKSQYGLDLSIYRYLSPSFYTNSLSEVILARNKQVFASQTYNMRPQNIQKLIFTGLPYWKCMDLSKIALAHDISRVYWFYIEYFNTKCVQLHTTRPLERQILHNTN